MVNKKKGIKEEMEIPNGIVITIVDGAIKIKGPKGEVIKKYLTPKIKIEVKDNKITLTGLKNKKEEKRRIGTIKANIKIIMVGCNEPYKYTLKICSGHFPMNVSVNKSEFIVKNFFGEKVPRTLKIKQGSTINIEGDLIQVESIDKELCGQVSADIEKLTRRVAYDRRIFQDGIYIIKKGEKEVK